MKSVELFAGAGGLALGAELAGFEPAMTVEWDRWACDTMRENKKRGYPGVKNWNIQEGDVRAVDWSGIEDVHLVTGGPPCQPFSAGGKARAHDDERDMFPATIEVVRQLRPMAFLVENVRGLTRSAFANYYQYILLRLGHPENVRREEESWSDHLHRLQADHTTTSRGLRYNVVPTLVNAADFGVPQQRHRVFFVGFRADLDAEFSFPKETHSLDGLLYDQWVSGEYWDRHRIAKSKRPELGSRYVSRVSALTTKLPGEILPAWRTVRDALVGLPEPTTVASKRFSNHLLQPGARTYPGHTGSAHDLPAKALKAGAHGVPGGENMLRKLDGSVRYFSVRESARLQTFPDSYQLHGSWGEAMRQLGNAVPVELAHVVASSVARHLLVADVRSASPHSSISTTMSPASA